MGLELEQPSGGVKESVASQTPVADEESTPRRPLSQQEYIKAYMPDYIMKRLVAGDAESPDPHWYIEPYHCHGCRKTYSKIMSHSRAHRKKRAAKEAKKVELR